MGEAKQELWKLLAEQITREQDPQKLLRLVQELNRLLEERQNQLAGLRGQGKPDETTGGATGNAPDPPNRANCTTPRTGTG